MLCCPASHLRPSTLSPSTIAIKPHYTPSGTFPYPRIPRVLTSQLDPSACMSALVFHVCLSLVPSFPHDRVPFTDSRSGGVWRRSVLYISTHIFLRYQFPRYTPHSVSRDTALLRIFAISATRECGFWIIDVRGEKDSPSVRAHLQN